MKASMSIKTFNWTVGITAVVLILAVQLYLAMVEFDRAQPGYVLRMEVRSPSGETVSRVAEFDTRAECESFGRAAAANPKYGRDHVTYTCGR